MEQCGGVISAAASMSWPGVTCMTLSTVASRSGSLL